METNFYLNSLLKSRDLKALFFCWKLLKESKFHIFISEDTYAYGVALLK